MNDYAAGWSDGYRYRAAVAKVAGLPSEVPLPCGCRLLLDYEQIAPCGPMPSAMEIHRSDCPAMQP